MVSEKFPSSADDESQKLEYHKASLEAERDLLLQVQANHQAILKRRGMLAVALSSIPGYNPDANDGLIRAFMTRKAATINLDKPQSHIHIVPAIRICSITPGKNPKSQDDKRRYHDVRVADIDEEGVMIPEPGFSYDDVEQAIDMLKGLQQARDMGVLSHLNDHLTAIRDPEDITSHHPSSNF